MYSIRLFNIALLLAMTLTTAARANNVDLSTVPKRDTVQLTIYNSEDLTLVRETRAITFKKGINPLQFSWANTLIDPTSVQLRFVSNPEKLEVLDTTFPHDKPQMLYWNVQSDIDGEATVEITYFTSGITWSADYLCIASKDEKQVSLDGFVRITNNSGEDYENARIRLVVGSINLVEKVAQLAGVPIGNVRKLEHERRSEFRKVAAKTAMAADSPVDRDQDEKQIIKEGLSEYFIFSIEGVETIPNGWSKRMRSMQSQTVPLKIQYRYRPQEYGEQLARMYLLANDKASKLGASPLPDGIVRVFRDNGRGGLSYLAAQSIKYIPIGDKIELNLGVDPNVRFELIRRQVNRDEIWVQLKPLNVFRRADQPGLQVLPDATVVGWNQHEVYAQRVQNHTAAPIEVEIRRTFPGHVVFRSQLKPALHDYQTVQFATAVGAGETADLRYEIVRAQGRNAKQNNVSLEDAAMAP